MAELLKNWTWVIIGHLIGAFFYALLYVIAITNFGQTTDHVMIQKLINVAGNKNASLSSVR